MAKTVKCAFCGKEMKAGFLGLFGGDDCQLKLGEFYLPCCSTCYENYKKVAELEGDRFAVKLNHFYEDGSFRLQIPASKEKIAQMFRYYLQQRRPYEPCAPQNFSGGFFALVESTKKSPVNSFLAEEAKVDLTGDSVAAYLEKAQELMKQEASRVIAAQAKGQEPELRKPWPFTAEDISCIKYMTGIGRDANGIWVEPIYVRLNDTRQMTYKPCVIGGVISYKNSLINGNKLRAETIEATLGALRTQLGVEHLPIVEAKSYKDFMQ